MLKTIIAGVASGIVGAALTIAAGVALAKPLGLSDKLYRITSEAKHRQCVSRCVELLRNVTFHDLCAQETKAYYFDSSR